MFESIKEIILQTPWWVYLLLYVLLQRGYAASKTRVVTFYKIAIIPVVFTGLSIYTIVTSLHLNALYVGTWIVAILLGTSAGWLMIKNTVCRIDNQKNLIEIPGSWRTLILILVIFGFKYFFGYMIGVQPAILKNIIFDEFMIVVSAFCSGMFIGNFIHYGKLYKSQPHTELKVKGKAKS